MHDKERSSDRVDKLAIVRFPVTFSFISSLCLLIVTGVYYYFTQSVKDTLVYLLAGCAAVGQITASFYTARTLGVMLSARREDRNWDRRRSAMGYGARWNDPSMYHVREVLREILDHDGTHDELIKVIEGKRTNVVHIMNFLEEIATSVKQGMSDEALLGTQFSGVVRRTWAKVFPWVQIHRSNRGANTIRQDLENLYNAWR